MTENMFMVRMASGLQKFEGCDVLRCTAPAWVSKVWVQAQEARLQRL